MAAPETPFTGPRNMARPRGVRCAALVLLLMCFTTAAAGLQPVNPRGWQAARQAEQRAAAAAAAGWAQLQGEQPEGLPAGAFQQTCGFTQLAASPESRAAGWPQLVAAFLCGMLASALLQYWLQQRRTRRRGPAAAGAGPGEVQHNQALQQWRPEDLRVEAERLEPAGSEAGQPQPPPVAPAASSAGPWPVPEAAGSVAGAAAQVGAPAGAAVGLEEAGESAAAGQSAAVVAVQELVMQQSSGASGAGSSASQGSSAAEAPGLPSGRGSPEEQHLQQQQQQPTEPVDTPAGAVDGSLQAPLLAQQQADIQAAGELVMSMCAALHIHPAQLLPGERLQLIHTTLHVWQAQQAQRAAEEMRRWALCSVSLSCCELLLLLLLCLHDSAFGCSRCQPGRNLYIRGACLPSI